MKEVYETPRFELVDADMQDILTSSDPDIEFPEITIDFDDFFFEGD